MMIYYNVSQRGAKVTMINNCYGLSNDGNDDDDDDNDDYDK